MYGHVIKKYYKKAIDFLDGNIYADYAQYAIMCTLKTMKQENYTIQCKFVMINDEIY